MSQSMTRLLAAGLTALLLAACTSGAVQPPPGPSSSNVNPITGARGGTNGSDSGGGAGGSGGSGGSGAAR